MGMWMATEGRDDLVSSCPLLMIVNPFLHSQVPSLGTQDWGGGTTVSSRPQQVVAGH